MFYSRRILYTSLFCIHSHLFPENCCRFGQIVAVGMHQHTPHTISFRFLLLFHTFRLRKWKHLSISGKRDSFISYAAQSFQGDCATQNLPYNRQYTYLSFTRSKKNRFVFRDSGVFFLQFFFRRNEINQLAWLFYCPIASGSSHSSPRSLRASSEAEKNGKENSAKYCVHLLYICTPSRRKSWSRTKHTLSYVFLKICLRAINTYCHAACTLRFLSLSVALSHYPVFSSSVITSQHSNQQCWRI